MPDITISITGNALAFLLDAAVAHLAVKEDGLADLVARDPEREWSGYRAFCADLEEDNPSGATVDLGRGSGC